MVNKGSRGRLLRPATPDPEPSFHGNLVATHNCGATHFKGQERALFNRDRAVVRVVATRDRALVRKAQRDNIWNENKAAADTAEAT